MDIATAISEYNQIVPQSHQWLRGCIGKSIRRVVWHQIDGDDPWGHLWESLELQFGQSSLFLRSPRRERSDRLDYVEFVANALEVEAPDLAYAMVTDGDEPRWRHAVASPIASIDLLMDLKDDRFARYHGLRFQLGNGHALGYHYPWGSKIGDPISRHAIATMDGPEPPESIGWAFVPWVPALTVPA